MKIYTHFSLHYFFKFALYSTMLIATATQIRADEVRKEAHSTNAVSELESYAEYTKMMSSTEPIIVMVHASWCGACKQFKPTFEKVAEKYKKNAHFYTWNESNKDLQKELTALGIQGFPTILYFKKDLGGTNEAGFNAKIRDFLGLPIEAVKVEAKAPPKKEAAKTSNAVKEIKTKKEYTTMLSGKKPAALLLYATWCGACTMFKPAFNDVAEKRSDVQFYMLDVDNEELAAEIRAFDATGIPTTIFFKPDGKTLKQHGKMVGARPIEGFNQEIDAIIKAKAAPAKKEVAPTPVPVKKNQKKNRKR